MKTKLLFLLVFQISTSFLYSQTFEKFSNKDLIPEIKVYSSGRIENSHVKSSKNVKAGELPTAVFEVTYTGFTDEAKAAFEKATELWSYLISSPVPIKIDARWERMETGVLGSSGPPAVFRNFRNAPLSNTWYHPSIANKLNGYDLDPESYDMVTRYNSNYSWYLGTDGICPSYQTDLVTIVLHEIAHGLGFSSNAYNNAANGGIAYYSSDGGAPAAWDHFMYNGNNELLMDTMLFKNPSPELLAEFTSNNIYFTSPLSDAANGGDPVELYAPSIWNGGSSISHLGEKFNNTEQALMTYSAGTGEVLHDPGSITLAMLAEIGWVNVRFMHEHLKDIEIMTNPITVDVEIYGDSSIYDNSVYLHYSSDNFTTDNKVLMTTLNDTLFTFDIPVLVADTVRYYFETKSTLERFYYYPSQGVLNAGSIDSTLYFIIGADNINPELSYEKGKDYIFDYEQAFKIQAAANDNLEIDSVYVEYKINDNEVKYLKLQFEGENLYGLPNYIIDIPLSNETLNDLDTLYYKLVATDASANNNLTILPETEYYKVSIQGLFEAEIDTIIDFDQLNDNSLFIFDGLIIDQPANFNSLGLNSPHPYQEGQGYPNNEINYSAILKIPIIIADIAKIVFDEIVIVEPGSEGANYGDTEFWDYVIVEGSKDSGKTWHEFEDGYDCKIASTFLAAFNNSTNGSSTMFKSHEIDLLGNENIVANDIVLIRFRLWSDPGAVGWGWAVDNIKIQKKEEEITSNISLISEEKGNMNIYPNPANSHFNIEYNSDELINEFNISIYNIDGKLVYSKNKLINSKLIKENINIEDINSGFYFVKLSTGKNVLIDRMIVN